MKNNKEIIEILEKEKRELYPYGVLLMLGCRGRTYTYTHTAHYLRYIGYGAVIDKYKNIDRKITLEEAHNEINDFVNRMIDEYKISDEIAKRIEPKKSKTKATIKFTGSDNNVSK